MSEKRMASRIKYRCGVTLSLENGISVDGYVQNLSLKGAYITGGDLTLFQEGDKCGFRIRLSGYDDDVVVTGEARVLRKGPGHALAVRFLSTDKASLSRLRRIIEINFADSDKVDKELQAVMEEMIVQDQKKNKESRHHGTG